MERDKRSDDYRQGVSGAPPAMRYDYEVPVLYSYVGEEGMRCAEDEMMSAGGGLEGGVMDVCRRGDEVCRR